MAKKTQTWATISEEYGMTHRAFKLAVAPIQKDLDKLAGRKNYKNLIPKVAKTIREFLGEPEEE